MVSTLAFIARPVVALLSLSTNGVLRLLRMKTEDEEEQVTEDEIRMMIDLGNENGAIDAEEKELLQNVFGFGDLSVSDAMTRVGDVTAIQVDTPPGEVLDVIRATGLSRFPVYGSDLNDILGILNAGIFCWIRVSRVRVPLPTPLNIRDWERSQSLILFPHRGVAKW